MVMMTTTSSPRLSNQVGVRSYVRRNRFVLFHSLTCQNQSTFLQLCIIIIRMERYTVNLKENSRYGCVCFRLITTSLEVTNHTHCVASHNPRREMSRSTQSRMDWLIKNKKGRILIHQNRIECNCFVLLLCFLSIHCPTWYRYYIA